MKIDDIDIRILNKLQLTGRITNLQLAADIGLSPAPTLERVKKLEQSGFIKSYHAIIDPKKIGLEINAYIQISISMQKKNAILSFVEQVKNINEVLECHQITGSSDFLLRIITKNLDTFENLVTTQLSKIEEIAQMQSMMILSTYKDTKSFLL